MNRRQAKKDFRSRVQADFDKAAYNAGCKDTVAKVIEIIHRRQEEREQLQDMGDWDNGYLSALEAVECEVMVMEGTE